jgi:hypothetical protein
MKLGVHLPLMEFGGEGLSRRRLMDAVDAARESGLAAVSTTITSSSRPPGSTGRPRLPP